MRKFPTLVIGLALVVSGCATGQRRNLPPDWSSGAHVESDAALEHLPTDSVLAPPPPATNRVEGGELAGVAGSMWIALDRWSRENNAGSLRAVAGGIAPAYSLATARGVFTFQTRSQSARWNGMEIRLGFEPQLIDGQPYLHLLDIRRNLEPLLQGHSLPPRGRRVIVVDPGHGGGNAGTRSVLDGVNEKEFTLDWALRMKPLLEAGGWQVHLTRTNDAEVPLPARVALAEELKADLFISLHFNSAAPSQEQAGLETFCLTPVGMPSTLTREYEDDATRVFPNNAHDTQNLQYAVRIHRELLRVVGTDRGIRRARFLGVLRGQNRPAVLLEGGYLSNPAEAGRVADPGYRQRLAEAVASAVTE